ncbi:MAG TPA: N-acetylmuramoyl-L-alanine amidase [Bacteroidia bacterium]|nr:N-acetylmuramoyl-L-alanine amidase [Bacteroidia bacterium]HNT79951.1 N-acetylmuramoyl-L-alanine amidase [Bacteroidia bacterium]
MTNRKNNSLLPLKLKSVFLIAVLITLSFISAHAIFFSKTRSEIKKVVIDAGHGGHDSGCLGSSGKEKHVALDISLKLGKLIESNYSDIEVVYTRKTDVFVELHERAKIANTNQADLFICIHCNAGNSAAIGAETYVMGLHKSDENLAVAKRENSAVLMEDDYKAKYDGFDPNSPEGNIIFTLFQNAFLQQSLLFAKKIQDQFEYHAGRYNRGVKQAGFLVLYKTTMPAVLIETGFLTNKTEEKFLLSDKGQDAIANSIYRAFKEYKIDMEKPGGAKPLTQTTQVDITPKETKPEVIASKEPTNNVVNSTPVKPVETPRTNNTEDPEIFFTVQIAASMAPTRDLNEKIDRIKESFAIKGSDGWTRYNVGKFSNKYEAGKRQSMMRSEGYKDAFVTAYNKNVRIKPEDAEALLKRK